MLLPCSGGIRLGNLKAVEKVLLMAFFNRKETGQHDFPVFTFFNGLLPLRGSKSIDCTQSAEKICF